MEVSHIRTFAHTHCRFKLRSGKEVYGVIWEVEGTDAQGTPGGGKLLFFSSIRDYERMRTEGAPVQVVPMEPEEIVWAERLAS
jgi:hypothetical protein